MRRTLPAYECIGNLPSYSSLERLAHQLGLDLYLYPTDFSWTLVLPHENGPFFALSSEGV